MDEKRLRRLINQCVDFYLDPDSNQASIKWNYEMVEEIRTLIILRFYC